jgi:RNA polymerase sigma factor (sigma-70 family)
VTAQPSDSPIEHLLRDLAPQVLGIVVRRFRDFAAAEDAVQEASLAAAMQWSRDGLPENPRAWLTQVAFRRMTDHIRSESARRRRESEAALEMDQLAPPVDFVRESDQDDTLILLFMCSHPALTPTSAIALTLRAVGGLTTAEIAHAFLVPEPTMAQRISRAKQSIKDSSIPFQLPTAEEQAQRLRAVLHVLYLIFNEGYTSSIGPHLRRADLSHEAMRLTRIVHHLRPDATEVAGLLALMLLTDARRLARTGAEGELIPLAQQDRALWDRQQIAEGVALLSATLPRGTVGPYQLQAAIAAVHDEAARPEDTDWPQILALYDLLQRMSDNPMVMLNHAIATAMVHGPPKGLDLLAALDSDARLANHHRLDSVRAHLLEMAGDHKAAIKHYRIAAGRTASIPERNYLMTQAARLSEIASSPDRTVPNTARYNH